MKPELEHQLYEKYPKLFRQKDLSQMETCMCWGVACGDGWHSLIDTACEKLQKLACETGYTIEFTQVKEKFGGLRMYLHIEENKEQQRSIDPQRQLSCGAVSELAHTITMEAENQSVTTCDQCGEQGKQRGGPWISTRCDQHAKNR